MRKLNSFLRFALCLCCILLLYACTSPYQQKQMDFLAATNEYQQRNLTDETYRNPQLAAAYFDGVVQISKRYEAARPETIFTVISQEAVKKGQGLPNQYDQLLAMFLTGDTQLYDTARGIQIREFASARCDTFGYPRGGADFNKCVYDVGMQYIQMVNQQQQQILQNTRPNPSYRQTNCVNTVNGVQCQTYGY